MVTEVDPTRGLTIPRSMADQLLVHSRAELPNEACALLSGDLATGTAVGLPPARNAEASPLRYDVHPDDLVRIIFEIDDAGRDLIGIFHSHTHTPAVPSPTDLRSAQYPDAFYVLATLSDPDASPADALRAWLIVNQHSTEVPLTISGS